MRCVVELLDVPEPSLLPPNAARLFAGPKGLDRVFSSPAWYSAVIQAALPEGATAHLILASIDNHPIALVPLQHDASGWRSLTTPYTCLYHPLAATDLPADTWRAIGHALGRHCRREGGLRLDALPADWPGLAPLSQGLRQAGLIALRYDHFGNWHQPTSGLDWPAYLAGRDGPLRETIRRRSARIARDPTIRFELFHTDADLERGIAAFEQVYASSWKQPEPYPHFNATLIRMAAARSILRLAVMWQATQPIAVQLWVIADGEAAVLKLAHDEAFRHLSPGTVLTAWTIRHLLDEAHASTLDFGRGDDAYKRQWAGLRRQRIGVAFVDPRCVSGLSALLRHRLGQIKRHISALSVLFIANKIKN